MKLPSSVSVAILSAHAIGSSRVVRVRSEPPISCLRGRSVPGRSRTGGRRRSRFRSTLRVRRGRGLLRRLASDDPPAEEEEEEASRRSESEASSSSTSSSMSCSRTRATVSILAFCDGTLRGERHRFFLGDGFLESGGDSYRSRDPADDGGGGGGGGDCHELSYEAKRFDVDAMAEDGTLNVGTAADGAIEDDWVVHLPGGAWHDTESCASYGIALSASPNDDDDRNPAVACWDQPPPPPQPAGGSGEEEETQETPRLSIPRCPEDYRAPEDSFTWYLEVRPVRLVAASVSAASENDERRWTTTRARTRARATADRSRDGGSSSTGTGRTEEDPAFDGRWSTLRRQRPDTETDRSSSSSTIGGTKRGEIVDATLRRSGIAGDVESSSGATTTRPEIDRLSPDIRPADAPFFGGPPSDDGNGPVGLSPGGPPVFTYPPVDREPPPTDWPTLSPTSTEEPTTACPPVEDAPGCGNRRRPE